MMTRGGYVKWIDGTDLEQWADRRDSQGLLPEAVRRLVYATVPEPRRVEFRSGEGVQYHGWDGYVEAPTGTVQVPEGISGWELGTNARIRAKANEDYATRTANPLGIDLASTAFVFVTPRRWDEKTAWAQEKQAEGVWREVRAYDADDLEAWLLQAPAVGAWLARQMNKYPAHVISLDDTWAEFTSTTNPPLTPGVLLAGRGTARERVQSWLREPPSILQVRADTQNEALAFVAACIMQLAQEEQDLLRSRTLTISDTETLRALSTTRSALTILYSGPDTAPAPTATQRGHHVLIPLPYGGVPLPSDVSLPRPSREGFAEALKAAGIPEPQASALARETGRSISALQRRLATVSRTVGPAWAQPPQVHDLLGMLFAGSWDDQRAADRDALAELTGKPYDDVARDAAAWSQGADAPLRRAGNTYAFGAARDAWEQAGRYLTRDALDRFIGVAQRVLSAEDPRLTLAPQDRWLAAIHGREPAHSGSFREGLARSLVFLSVLGASNTIPHDAEAAARYVVRQVLSPDAGWQRWYAIASVLPLLAETAPEEFLAALQGHLAPAAPDLMRLFDEEGGGFSPSSMHTHLLWSLETLAWDPTFLSPVTLSLGRLARFDPGVRLHNRPINTLRGIFLLWHPNTTATLAQRVQALDLLLARESDVAWDLLVKLLPKDHDIGEQTAQPQWRRVVARPEVTNYEHYQGVVQVLDRALTAAGMDAARLSLLVSECGSWPPAARERLAAQLLTFTQSVDAANARATLWAAVRDLVHNHRAYETAEWALEEDALAPFAAVQEQLIPADVVVRFAWLFDDWWPGLGQPHGADHAASDAAIEHARDEAIDSVLAAQGQAGLLALAQAAKYPDFVGRSAAKKITTLAHQRELLLASLTSLVPNERSLGRALVIWWYDRFGEAWVDELLTAPITEDADRTTAFLFGLPAGRAVWDRVTAFGPDIAARYWPEVRVWLPRTAAVGDVTYAIDCLLSANRALHALELVGNHIERLPGALLVRVLDAVRDALVGGAPIPTGQHFRFELERIVARLEGAGVDEQDIARLEWFYLPFLSHGRYTTTLSLHRQLARDPSLFADIISAAYDPLHRNHDEEHEPTEQETSRARLAYELLSSWHVLPGSTATGVLDAAGMGAWVDQARARCTANDRQAKGDHYIGRALAWAPAGADNIWPHPAVRDLIERLASQDIENGIANETFNKRGAVIKDPYEGGVQERAIATRYHGYAEALAVTNPQTAGMLRRIAEDYERAAQREDIRAERRDLD